MRGRTYLNSKRVVDVHIDGGTVSARVIGHRRVPYHGTIAVRPIAADVWHTAIGLIAQDSRCVASMRQGVLSLEVVETFEVAGDALLPRDAYAVSMQCGCQARGDTCDHIMGVHMWIAAAVDRDPFLLFTLRGESKDAVLGAMAGAIHNGLESGSHSNANESTRDDTLLGATSRDTPANSSAEPLHQLLGPEAAGAAFDSWRLPVAALSLNRDTGAPSDQLLAQLGDPPGWDGKSSLHETLAPVYRGAARRARAMLSTDV